METIRYSRNLSSPAQTFISLINFQQKMMKTTRLKRQPTISNLNSYIKK